MNIKGKRILSNGTVAGYVKQKDGTWKWKFLKGGVKPSKRKISKSKKNNEPNNKKRRNNASTNRGAIEVEINKQKWKNLTVTLKIYKNKFEEINTKHYVTQTQKWDKLFQAYIKMWRDILSQVFAHPTTFSLWYSILFYPYKSKSVTEWSNNSNTNANIIKTSIRTMYKKYIQRQDANIDDDYFSITTDEKYLVFGPIHSGNYDYYIFFFLRNPNGLFNNPNGTVEATVVYISHSSMTFRKSNIHHMPDNSTMFNKKFLFNKSPTYKGNMISWHYTVPLYNSYERLKNKRFEFTEPDLPSPVRQGIISIYGPVYHIQKITVNQLSGLSIYYYFINKYFTDVPHPIVRECLDEVEFNNPYFITLYFLEELGFTCGNGNEAFQHLRYNFLSPKEMERGLNSNSTILELLNEYVNIKFLLFQNKFVERMITNKSLNMLQYTNSKKNFLNWCKGKEFFNKTISARYNELMVDINKGTVYRKCRHHNQSIVQYNTTKPQHIYSILSQLITGEFIRELYKYLVHIIKENFEIVESYDKIDLFENSLLFNTNNKQSSNQPSSNENGQRIFGEGLQFQPSFNQSSFNQPSFNQSSFNQQSFNQPSFNQQSFNQPSFNQQSFNQNGQRIFGEGLQFQPSSNQPSSNQNLQRIFGEGFQFQLSKRQHELSLLGDPSVWKNPDMQYENIITVLTTGFPEIDNEYIVTLNFALLNYKHKPSEYYYYYYFKFAKKDDPEIIYIPVDFTYANEMTIGLLEEHILCKQNFFCKPFEYCMQVNLLNCDPVGVIHHKSRSRPGVEYDMATYCFLGKLICSGTSIFE